MTGRHRDDGTESKSGDLFEDKNFGEDRTMESDSGGIQGFEYFGVDTRDEEEDK